MKEKGNNEKSIVSLVIAGILLVLLVIFYYIVISNKKELTQIIALVITGLFLLANIYYIVKNNNIMKKSKKMVKKVKPSLPSQNPLEVYLISSIWKHQKITIGKGQISSALLYEISEENILFDKETLSISPKLDLDNLSFIESYLLETVFLDSVSNQQSKNQKLMKLKKMQKEKTALPLVSISENITKNIRNKDAVHSLTLKITDYYFETVENDFTALLTILSVGIAFFNLVEAITFMSTPTVINFYVPVVFALLLVATITSKSRERVLLKENQVEEITKVLNYISSLSTKEITASDKVYLCSLGLSSKEEREQIINLFCIE